MDILIFLYCLNMHEYQNIFYQTFHWFCYCVVAETNKHRRRKNIYMYMYHLMPDLKLGNNKVYTTNMLSLFQIVQFLNSTTVPSPLVYWLIFNNLMTNFNRNNLFIIFSSIVQCEKPVYSGIMYIKFLYISKQTALTIQNLSATDPTKVLMEVNQPIISCLKCCPGYLSLLNTIFW